MMKTKEIDEIPVIWSVEDYEDITMKSDKHWLTGEHCWQRRIKEEEIGFELWGLVSRWGWYFYLSRSWLTWDLIYWGSSGCQEEGIRIISRSAWFLALNKEVWRSGLVNDKRDNWIFSWLIICQLHPRSQGSLTTSIEIGQQGA